MSTDEIAILRIELIDIEPLIWRRIAVRASTNLQTLHRIIQASMGWFDQHLWEFTVGGAIYGIPDPEEHFADRPVQRANMVKLAKLIGQGVTELSYVYDMGDDWRHRLIIECLKPAERGTLYPAFLGGERCCPPEDCGGIPGYYAFLDVIAAPDGGKGSRKKKEALGWHGGPYDPDDIDEQQIRIALSRIANAYRTGDRGSDRSW